MMTLVGLMSWSLEKLPSFSEFLVFFVIYLKTVKQTRNLMKNFCIICNFIKQKFNYMRNWKKYSCVWLCNTKKYLTIKFLCQCIFALFICVCGKFRFSYFIFIIFLHRRVVCGIHLFLFLSIHCIYILWRDSARALHLYV